MPPSIPVKLLNAAGISSPMAAKLLRAFTITSLFISSARSRSISLRSRPVKLASAVVSAMRLFILLATLRVI